MKKVLISLFFLAFAGGCTVATIDSEPEQDPAFGSSEDDLRVNCRAACKGKKNKLVCLLKCRAGKMPCGDNFCGQSEYCCNDSCGTCVGFDEVCTQQICECNSDDDCRTLSNYCGGCSCEGLPDEQANPVCDEPLVTCFVNPCMGKQAACVAGSCVAQ